MSKKIKKQIKMTPQPEKVTLEEEAGYKFQLPAEPMLQKEWKGPISPEARLRMLKILWFSVSPHIKSGYGMVTNYAIKGLINRGYNVIISSYYGIESGGFLKMGDMIVVPNLRIPGADKWGFKSVKQHFQKFQRDICVYFTDFWVAEPLTKLVPDIYCYTPIDHEDYPVPYQNVLKGFKGVAAPSKHGVKEIKKYGIDAVYLPHGVDTSIYHPLNKDQCRQYFGIKPDQKVLGIVAANSDREPRKGWDAMFQAIKLFLNKHKEMRDKLRVIVHTNPRDPRGYNLFGLSRALDIDKYITFQDPYMCLLGLPNEMMARLFNCFDVLMNLASREGYCLPMAEAGACGVPSIGTKFSAMIERCNRGKCGWLIEPKGTRLSPLNAKTAIPDEIGAAEALEEALYNEKKRKRFGKKALEWNRTFDWNRVLDDYWIPWLNGIAEEYGYGERKPLKERKVLEV